MVTYSLMENIGHCPCISDNKHTHNTHTTHTQMLTAYRKRRVGKKLPPVAESSCLWEDRRRHCRSKCGYWCRDLGGGSCWCSHCSLCWLWTQSLPRTEQVLLGLGSELAVPPSLSSQTKLAAHWTEPFLPATVPKLQRTSKRPGSQLQRKWTHIVSSGLVQDSCSSWSVVHPIQDLGSSRS